MAEGEAAQFVVTNATLKANATLKSDATTGTINDDDALPVLSIADATAVAEGEAAQFERQDGELFNHRASEDYTAASSRDEGTDSP